MNLLLQAGSPRRQKPGPLRLTLAPVHHAEVGTPIRYYRDGYSLAQDYTGIEFSFSGPGTMVGPLWSWTPDAPGERILTLRDNQGGKISQRIIVHPNSGTGPLVTLCHGDSITAAGGTGGWPKQMYDALNTAGVSLTMRGTRQGNPSPQTGVYHEGFPGRTYRWFHVGDALEPYNPFLFTAGEPAYNGTYSLPDYLMEYPGAAPTLVSFALGTNDVGPINNSPGIEANAQAIIDDAAFLRTQFRTHLPGIQVAFFLTYNANNEYSHWEGTGFAYDRWQWRQNRHRVVEKMIETFYGQPDTHVINSHACLADADIGDTVHPNSVGHTKIMNQAYPLFRHIARLAAA